MQGSAQVPPDCRDLTLHHTPYPIAFITDDVLSADLRIFFYIDLRDLMPLSKNPIPPFSAPSASALLPATVHRER